MNSVRYEIKVDSSAMRNFLRTGVSSSLCCILHVACFVVAIADAGSLLDSWFLASTHIHVQKEGD